MAERRSATSHPRQSFPWVGPGFISPGWPNGRVAEGAALQRIRGLPPFGNEGVTDVFARLSSATRLQLLHNQICR
jgi:hypothetical protein